MTITSDADLPRCLSTRTKQFKKAKQLAEVYFARPVKKVLEPDIQGFFSRTAIIIFKDESEIVIQFRIEPLNVEAFNTARQVLGAIVPEIGRIEDEELESEGIQVFWMTRMLGKAWFAGIRGKEPSVHVNILSSLGRIFAQGKLADRSDDVVDLTIRTHLELILASTDDRVTPYHDRARTLLGQIEQLKAFPLFVAHFDLNMVNIMIDPDSGVVTGLVDWELSSPLPLGVGFGRLHTLAGETHGGEFYMPPEFLEADAMFWQELLTGLPADTRAFVTNKPEQLQLAFTLGTLMSGCPVENGVLIMPSNVTSKALPKHLTYRIPALRGSEPPYTI